MTEFSLISEIQVSNPTKEREHEFVKSSIDQALLAEDLGFDQYWAVEHHTLQGYSISTAPEVLLSYIAAKTSRIRIGHGVVCLPIKTNHPVRVAERTAMLDVLSNGRLNVGFGRSSSPIEKDVFDVSDDESKRQLPEAARAIVEMWTQEEAEYQSEDFRIIKRPYRPRPVQEPHPPLSLACTRDDSLENAGKWGFGVMSNGIDGPNQVRRKRELYDAAIAARQPGDVIAKQPNKKFSATVFTTVLDDRDEARRLGLRGQRYFMEAAAHFFGGGPIPNPDVYKDEDSIPSLIAATANKDLIEAVGLANLANMDPDDLNPLDRSNAAYGNAKDTIEFVEHMFDAGVDEILFVVQIGGVPLDVVMETITQIGKKVIPHFRKKAPTVIPMSKASA
jgi:alkanesulfonate monooxygenase SsuD/methylene tetrahydromethanopterin reductase-like flavin-dependent oxidoreductase (luciferase family)